MQIDDVCQSYMQKKTKFRSRPYMGIRFLSITQPFFAQFQKTKYPDDQEINIYHRTKFHNSISKNKIFDLRARVSRMPASKMSDRLQTFTD